MDVPFAGWAHLKSKVTPYFLRNVDTPDHPRLRAASRDKADPTDPWSVPGYIESFPASCPFSGLLSLEGPRPGNL